MKDVLAYDLGGSSFRLAVITPSGEILQFVRLPMSTPKGNGGEYEVDPALWWDKFKLGVSELVDRGADFSEVGAIVGCGFTRTQVMIGATGNVVHPAITFQDSRGANALTEYLKSASADLRERAPNLSPYHPVARLLWLKKNKPEVWAKVATILEPKDFVNFKLTGVSVTDRISINAPRSFFDAVEDDQRSKEVLGFTRNVFPKAVSPFDQVGLVRDDMPPELACLVGKPVICGSADTWTCVLGSGGLNPGAAYNISGTSDVFGTISKKKSSTEGLMTVQWGPDLWQLGGPSQGAASRLLWAVEKFRPDLSLASAIEEAHAAASNPPVFLPFLEGERTPFWDADLRGAFVGIDSSHTNLDFIQSVSEGINFLSRTILQRAEAATGETVAHICFSGGLSNNPILCQLKADCLNRAVFVPEIKESGLVGAASMAFVTSDRISDITHGFLKRGTWFRPDPGTRKFYDERFSIFEDACAAIAGLSHRLSRLNTSHHR